MIEETVFVSSPVDGLIKEHRDEAGRFCHNLRCCDQTGRFSFYMYEYHYNRACNPGETYAQSIVRHAEERFGAVGCSVVLLLFAERIGDGTREEFELFRDRITDPNCNTRLMWRHIDLGQPPSEEVRTFMDELYAIGVEQLPENLFYDYNKPEEFAAYLFSTLIP